MIFLRCFFQFVTTFHVIFAYFISFLLIWNFLFSRAGTVLSNETVVESAKDLATYDGLDFSQFFGDLQSRMRNMFKNVFSHPFFGADDDFPDFGQK